MKIIVSLIALMFAFALSACTQKQPETPPRPVLTVGVDPIHPQMLEQDTFSISYWLESGAKHRTLVRLSAFDGLSPVKEDVFASVEKAAQARDYWTLLAMGNVGASGALYTQDNAVYLAHRLGIIDEVYWVVPVFGTISQQDLEGFKGYLKMRLPGRTKEIDAISLKGKMAQGEVNGVPVTIVGLQDLPKIDRPVILDVDLTYLASLYQDERKTRTLSFVSGFFKTLQERGLTSDFVTLSASNVNGLVSFKFRFLVRYLSELFGKPGMIYGQPPDLWSERADAWKAEQMSPKESVAIYRNIAKNYPDDPTSRYDLSSVYFGLGDLEGCKKELADAVSLDPGYRAAYGEFAGRLAVKGKVKDAKAFMALAGRR